MQNQVIRLLLVHDILLRCNIIVAALEDEEDISVVDCPTTIEEAVE